MYVFSPPSPPPLSHCCLQVALKHKLTSLQKDIQTYLHQPMIILQQDHSTSHKKLQQQLQRLVQHCEQLEETLGDTTDELEELRDQYLLLQQEKDSTPGTLLFFSILSITKLPEILTSHITSLGHIKELINGSEHFDYMKLRKYLENSCQALPQFQQLLKKYSTLYKKWIQQRSKIFFEKKLIGANADQHFICPLCSHDNRDDILGGATPSGLSPKFGVGGIGAGGGMKPMLQSLQSYVYPTPGVGSSQGLRKGTAMKGVSRGMISSRSLNAPLGSIIR